MIERGMSTVVVAVLAGAGLVPPLPAGAGSAAAAVPAGASTVAAGAPGPAVGITAPAAAAGAVQVAAPRARVRTGGGPLNVRRNASTWHRPVRRLSNGATLRPTCKIAGERVVGRVRTTAVWLKIGKIRYVSDAYVRWQPRRPVLRWCNQPSYPAPEARASFIRWAAKRARVSHRRYRVPVSVTIAQAINESGWGRSALTTEGNAYFGIKCFGTPGPIAEGCRPYRTHECNDDDCFATRDQFRVYRNVVRSFLDHGRFLTVNPRYQRAFDFTGNPNRFAREIHRAGYATSPTYSRKLIALMRHYNLYRYDR